MITTSKRQVSSQGRAILTGIESQVDDFQAAWKLVTKINLYDPIATGSDAGAVHLLFQGEIPVGVNGNLLVIGKDSIKDAAFLSSLAVASLSVPISK